MRCSSCGEDSFSYNEVGTDTYCNTCFSKLVKCNSCGSLSIDTLKYNNGMFCYQCHSNYLKRISDPRIQNLINMPIKAEDKIDISTEANFESLSDEALCASIIQKHYDLIGASQSATLLEIREKCKEIMKVWHPGLHKGDQQKYDEAVKRANMLKQAYDAIAEIHEEPYKVLELKYGASRQEINTAYQNLLSIYDSRHFSGDRELCKRIANKREELKNAYNKLTTHVAVDNDTSKTKIICSNCGYERYVPHENLPKNEVKMSCPKCHKWFTAGASSATKEQDPTATPIKHAQSTAGEKLTTKVQLAPTLRDKQASNKIIEGKPWRRFWARLIDMSILSFPIGLLIGLVFPSFTIETINKHGVYVFNIICMPGIMFSEAIILFVFGTTLGKFLLNIYVSGKDGEGVSFISAAIRSFSLYVKGFALGFPLINMITMAYAADKIRKCGVASWDNDAKTQVEYGELSLLKAILAILILIGIFILHTISNMAGR